MPFIYVPDGFTISDDEFRASKAAQERIYSVEGDRQADRTYIDALGHARWDTDYLTLRMAGYTHEDALQEMRCRIREAWRPTALPALEPHPAKPDTPAPPAGTGTPGPNPSLPAIQRIQEALRQADREEPQARIKNTKASCFGLLKRALQLVGPDFAYLGKTATMDGDGKYTPPGFAPRQVTATRPDGQGQIIIVIAVSMDAVWYLPLGQQIKAIVNSTDGEPGGAGNPARFDSYLIKTDDYRWHNPPIVTSSV